MGASARSLPFAARHCARGSTSPDSLFDIVTVPPWKAPRFRCKVLREGHRGDRVDWTACIPITVELVRRADQGTFRIC